MRDKMPIGGFWGPVKNSGTPYKGASKNLITDEVYKLIRELGINYISYIERDYTADHDEITENLKLAEKYQIGIFIRDKAITNDLSAAALETKISEYGKYPAFAGITVCDEPGNENYCVKSPHINTFSRIASMINRSEGICGYVNLFPKFGKYEDLDAAYESYINEYLDTCSPKFLSYDYYPFLDAQTNRTCVEYFEHLTYLSAKAKQKGIPLWPFIEVGGYFWDSRDVFNQIIPTRGQMLWNVNHCLAFGAKGIQYFPLVQPTYFGVVSDDTQDFDRMGLIAANGQPTKWYAYVRDANVWIAQIEHILMNSTHRRMLATGSVCTQISKISRDSDGRFLKSIQVENQEYGVITGVFDYKGQTVYYVVNYDYENSQEAELCFDAAHSVTVYNQSGEKRTGTTDCCSLVLQAGNAALVILDQEVS